MWKKWIYIRTWENNSIWPEDSETFISKKATAQVSGLAAIRLYLFSLKFQNVINLNIHLVRLDVFHSEKPKPSSHKKMSSNSYSNKQEENSNLFLDSKFHFFKV